MTADSIYSSVPDLTKPNVDTEDFRFVRIIPQSAFVATNTLVGPTVVDPTLSRFQFRVDRGFAWRPEESFFRLKARVSKESPAVTIVAGDNIALARWGNLAIWERISTDLGGTNVELVRYPGQAAMIANLTQNSLSRLSTAGQDELAAETLAEREALTIGLTRQDTIFRIPSAFHQSEHWIIAPGLVQFDLQPHASWARYAMETAEAKVPGTGYNIELTQLEYFAAVYRMSPDVKVDSLYVNTLRGFELQRGAVPAVTDISTRFNLNVPAFKVFTFTQLAAAGTDTSLPITHTSNTGLINESVEYDGRRRPDFDRPFSFVPAGANWFLPFKEWLHSTFGANDTSGSSLTATSWGGKYTIFGHQIVHSEAINGLDLTLNLQWSAAFSGQSYVAAASQQYLVLGYNTHGELQTVSKATNDRDLIAKTQSAVAQSSGTM